MAVRRAQSAPDRAVWLVFIFFLALYLFTAKGKITVIDGLIRYHVTASIVERGSLALPPGWPTTWKLYHHGLPYSYYSLGQSLAALPVYLVGRAATGIFPQTDPALITQAAYSFLNPFLVAGLCAVCFAFARRLGYARPTALWLAFALGLGTVFWEQSKDSFEHPQEALLGLAGVLFAYRGLKEQRRLFFVVSGMLLGAALLTRESALWFFLPTLVYLFLKSWRQATAVAAAGDPRPDKLRLLGKAALPVLLCIAGALPCLLVIGWYNFVRSGSFLLAGHVATGHFKNFHSSIPWGLAGLVLSPGRGLLEYDPVLLLLLVFPGSLLLFWRRDRALAALFAAITVSYLLFYAHFTNWADGLSWGPRYITAIIPLILLPLGEVFESAYSPQPQPRLFSIKRALVWALFAVSVAIQLTSVLIDHQIWFHEVAVRNQHGENLAINSVPQNSPILHQWLNLAKVIAPARFGRVWGRQPSEVHGRPALITTTPFCTGADFWWLCSPAGAARLFRFVAALLLALLVLISAGLLARRNRNLPHVA